MQIKNYTFDSKNHVFGKTYAGMIEDTDSAGGYTVPSPLADWFVNVLAKNSWCRRLFQVRPMPGKTFTIPQITSGDAVYLSGEGLSITTEGGADQASTSYTRPVWDTITLTAKKFNGITGYSTEVEEDSALNVADIAMQELARSLVEFEERAFIQGEAGGSKFGWTAGDTRYAWDGLIDICQGDNAGTGANWTPDSSTNSNWTDAEQDKLTADDLNNLLADIEDQKGTCDALFMAPRMLARMRDMTEFEALQTLDKIGDKAALLTGAVAKWYTANIYVSHDMPEGVAVFNSATEAPKDTLILALDTRYPVIADRRKYNVLTRHNFDTDVNEIRINERLAFGTLRPEMIAGLADVQLAI